MWAETALSSSASHPMLASKEKLWKDQVLTLGVLLLFPNRPHSGETLWWPDDRNLSYTTSKPLTGSLFRISFESQGFLCSGVFIFEAAAWPTLSELYPKASRVSIFPNPEANLSFRITYNASKRGFSCLGPETIWQTFIVPALWVSSELHGHLGRCLRYLITGNHTELKTKQEQTACWAVSPPISRGVKWLPWCLEECGVVHSPFSGFEWQLWWLPHFLDEGAQKSELFMVICVWKLPEHCLNSLMP